MTTITTSPDEAPWIHARVVPPHCDESVIERIGPLTPYMTQTIVEDALASGRGTTVQLEMRSPDPRHVLERLRRRVDLLTGRGIHVALRRRATRPRTPRAA
jgi:hypothetical protein